MTMRGKPEDTTYKLSASLHFAHCSTLDMKCIIDIGK